MDIPWDVILGSAGLSTIVVFLVVYFARQSIDLATGAAKSRLDASLERAEEVWRRRLEFGGEVDVELRKTREIVYKELWLLTRRLPKWPRALDVTYTILFDLSRELQDWYFEKGGLYMSKATREAYGRVQLEIANVLCARAGAPLDQDDYSREAQHAITQMLEAQPSALIENPEYTSVMRAFSELRTSLTDDLLSRRGAPIRGES